MDELRQFIVGNEDSALENQLPDGDEVRFFARLEEKPRELHFRRMAPRRKVSFARVTAVPIAACLLCFLALQLYLKSFQAGNILDSIYSEYRSEALALSNQIMEMSETDEDAFQNQRTIEVITFEAIPMAELLPEELSLKERAEIMKGYYAQKINGMKKFKDSLNNNLKNN